MPHQACCTVLPAHQARAAVFHGRGGGPFGKPPDKTSIALISVKLLMAMQPNMMPNATALLTLNVACSLSRALLKKGAAARAAVRRKGRSTLPMAK